MRSSTHSRKFKLKPVQKEFAKIRRAYVLLLVVPLAVQVILFKLIKFSILQNEATHYRTFENFLGQLLVENAPLPMLLSCVGIIIGLLLFNRFTAIGVFFVPVVVAIVGGIGYSLNLILDSVPAWVSWEFLEIIRMDVFLILALAAAFLPGLRYLNGKLLTAHIVIIHFVTIAVGCLTAFEFGYFVETGSLADSYLLVYSVKHANNAATVLASEMSATKIMLLSLPIIFASLPIGYRLIARSKKKIERFDVHKKSVPMNTPLLAATAAIIFFVPSVPVSPGLTPIRDNIVSQMVEGVRFSNQPFDIVENENELFRIPSEPARLVESHDATARNLIIVILESTGAGSTTLYNPEIDTTPFLDSLKMRGFVVEDMSVVVPHTNKALIPILCGVYPKLSQDESQLSPSTRCLPELLNEFGYTSAFFTPAQLEFENKGRLLEQAGFDHAFGDGDFDVTGYSSVNYFGYEDQVVVKPIVEWVNRQQKDNKPFLLSYLTLTPHHDYTVPAAHERKEYYPDDRERDAYLNTVAYQDNVLSDLFSRLEEAGALDSTSVIIVGDHGEAFGEHGMRYHSSAMWQEVMHVPAVILTPDGSNGIIEGPRQHQDLLQTAADLLGYEVEGDNFPGTSLFDSVGSDRTLYMAGWLENQSMAMRTGKMKYIYRFRRSPAEYYDLSVDPEEKTNLTGDLTDEARAAIEMEALQWRAAVNRTYDLQP
ncbi:MAG: sulfatase-like hydrolase/transferase [Rhodothermales bacterium]|nr:sulfatase-like hydrolase/transferase [Rhodothermales bacterium]